MVERFYNELLCITYGKMAVLVLHIPQR